MAPSGIEYAIYRRLQLFELHNVDYRLLVSTWNVNLAQNIVFFHLNAQKIINLYDYYQNTTNISERKLTPEELDYGFLPSEFKTDDDTKVITVKDQQNNLRAQVTLAPNQQIATVTHFDSNNIQYAVDYYDCRGFKSSTKYYANAKVETQVWYNLKQQIVLRAHRNKHDSTCSYSLIDLKQHRYHFDGKQALVAHFLEEINNSTVEKNIFMLERLTDVAQAVKQLTKPTFKVVMIHNSHTVNANEPTSKLLNNNFMFGLENAANFTAVVSSTEKQAEMIQKRYPAFKYNYAIPVGDVPEIPSPEKQIMMRNRKAGKIVVACRIASEKRLDHLIMAVNIVKESIPNVTLDIYGTGSKDEKTALNTLVAKLDLSDIVTFKGQTDNVAAAYQTGQIFTVTSTMEGFNISALEALEQGVVGVTYDVNYGPNELIQNDFNGYVVPDGDYRALANKIIDLFSDDALLQQMSTHAYTSTGRYTRDKVWQGWQKLINDAKNEDYL